MTNQDGGRNRLPLTKFSPLSNEALQAAIERAAIRFWDALDQQDRAQAVINGFKTEAMNTLEDEIKQVKSQLAALEAQRKELLDQQRASHQMEFTELELTSTHLLTTKRDLGWLLAERSFRIDKSSKKDVPLARAIVNGAPCALTVGTIAMNSYTVVDPDAFLDWLGPTWRNLVKITVTPDKGGETVNTRDFNDHITLAIRSAMIANDPEAVMPKGIEINPFILKKVQADDERPVRWVVLDEATDNLPTIEQLIESIQQPESEAVSATSQR